MSDDTLETPIIFTFGKHTGQEIEDVPCSYLMWLYEQKWTSNYPDILAYIEQNLEAIEEGAAYEEGDEESYFDDGDWKWRKN